MGARQAMSIEHDIGSYREWLEGEGFDPEPFPSLSQSDEDDRRQAFNGGDRGDLRDEGRSDGYGESYAERNT